MPDLRYFIIALVFLSGAAGTALSVAAIVASDVLNVSLVYIAAGALVGLVTAVIGLAIFRWLLRVTPLATPQRILFFNILVFILLLIYVPYANNLSGFFLISVIGGSQIGAVGSFSRSIISSLIPQHRQGRLFTFYELTQESTGWIGKRSTTSSFYRSIA